MCPDPYYFPEFVTPPELFSAGCPADHTDLCPPPRTPLIVRHALLRPFHSDLREGLRPNTLLATRPGTCTGTLRPALPRTVRRRHPPETDPDPYQCRHPLHSGPGRGTQGGGPTWGEGPRDRRTTEGLLLGRRPRPRPPLLLDKKTGSGLRDHVHQRLTPKEKRRLQTFPLSRSP